jgi:hypothetical protein
MTEELALLSGDTRRVLDGASVAGDPFEPELAAAASDVTEQRAMEAIDELLHRDLVRRPAYPGDSGFVIRSCGAPSTRRTPGAWRIGAHQRTAQALAHRGAGPGLLPTTSTSRRRSETKPPSPLTVAGREAAACARDRDPMVHRCPATAPDTAAVDQHVDLLLANATALAATGASATPTAPCAKA